MNSIEAMIYCLGFTNDTMEDGSFYSQTVYDCNGEPHWFIWTNESPKMCSETPDPFSSRLAPYRTNQIILT